VSAWIERRARWQKSAGGRALLAACSFFYGLAVWARRLAYDRGWKKSEKLRAKVICIGNLTTGGTGKTPAAVLAAQTLRHRNHKVAILSRGYGRVQKDAPVVTLLDDSVPKWSECGDEPWIMKSALAGQGVPILVSPDRVLSGGQAIGYYHAKALILDDGFQHFRLKRDLDVVLVNALDPFGGGSLLPLGNLREPLSALKRADMIVLTHVDLVLPETLEGVKSEVRRHNKKAPILESVHQADFLLDVKSQERLPFDRLKGQDLSVFSGLGNPEAFERQLEGLGARITQRWRYPDHHPYTATDIASIERLRAGAKIPLVTTFKDLAKLPEGWEKLVGGDFWAVAIKLEIVKGKNQWIDTLCSGL
jgi:tetraacyldisaccharide 4'-kinase